MLSGLAWLALEVKYLDDARGFYEESLSLSVRTVTETEVRYAAGETDLVIRRPTAIPRGGLHTHYAFSIPHAEYDDWWNRLSTEYDLQEATFGESRSLYCYDPDGNCVELGQQDVDGPGIDGIFEVVLEVASLESAVSFYRDLGFEPYDHGSSRRRVRLQGPFALELWEPHLGIADARGGVHVDLGFTCESPEEAIARIEDRCLTVDFDAGTVVDPDGHHLSFHAT